MGFAFAPLGGLIGFLIFIIVMAMHASPSGYPFPQPALVEQIAEWFGVMVFGGAVGAIFAAPATCVVFPLLYLAWPKRGVSSFVLVLAFSAVSGFVSPYVIKPLAAWEGLTNRVNVAPYYNVRVDWQTHMIHFIKNDTPKYEWRPRLDPTIGLVGMSSAVLLMPLYFVLTRPRRVTNA